MKYISEIISTLRGCYLQHIVATVCESSPNWFHIPKNGLLELPSSIESELQWHFRCPINKLLDISPSQITSKSLVSETFSNVNNMRGFAAHGSCCLKEVKSKIRDFFSCKICVRAILMMAQEGTIVEQHCIECHSIFQWLQHYFPVSSPAARTQGTPAQVEPGPECQICARKRSYLRDQRHVRFYRVHQLLCMPCEEITYNWQE